MYAKEALDCGLVNRVEDSQEAVLGNIRYTHSLKGLMIHNYI